MSEEMPGPSDPILSRSPSPSAGFYHHPTASAFRVVEPRSQPSQLETFLCMTCGRQLAAFSLLVFHSALCSREKRMTVLKKSLNEAQKRETKTPYPKNYFCFECGLLNSNPTVFAKHCRVVHCSTAPEFQNDSVRFKNKLSPWTVASLKLPLKEISKHSENLRQLYIANTKFEISKLEQEHAKILEEASHGYKQQGSIPNNSAK